MTSNDGNNKTAPLRPMPIYAPRCMFPKPFPGDIFTINGISLHPQHAWKNDRFVPFPITLRNSLPQPEQEASNCSYELPGKLSHRFKNYYYSPWMAKSRPVCVREYEEMLSQIRTGEEKVRGKTVENGGSDGNASAVRVQDKWNFKISRFENGSVVGQRDELVEKRQLNDGHSYEQFQRHVRHQEQGNTIRTPSQEQLREEITKMDTRGRERKRDGNVLFNQRDGNVLVNQRDGNVIVNKRDTSSSTNKGKYQKECRKERFSHESKSNEEHKAFLKKTQHSSLCFSDRNKIKKIRQLPYNYVPERNSSIKNSIMSQGISSLASRDGSKFINYIPQKEVGIKNGNMDDVSSPLTGSIKEADSKTRSEIQEKKFIGDLQKKSESGEYDTQNNKKHSIADFKLNGFKDEHYKDLVLWLENRRLRKEILSDQMKLKHHKKQECEQKQSKVFPKILPNSGTYKDYIRKLLIEERKTRKIKKGLRKNPVFNKHSTKFSSQIKARTICYSGLDPVEPFTIHSHNKETGMKSPAVTLEPPAFTFKEKQRSVSRRGSSKLIPQYTKMQKKIEDPKVEVTETNTKSVISLFRCLAQNSSAVFVKPVDGGTIKNEIECNSKKAENVLEESKLRSDSRNGRDIKKSFEGSSKKIPEPKVEVSQSPLGKIENNPFRIGLKTYSRGNRNLVDDKAICRNSNGIADENLHWTVETNGNNSNKLALSGAEYSRGDNYHGEQLMSQQSMQLHRKLTDLQIQQLEIQILWKRLMLNFPFKKDITEEKLCAEVMEEAFLAVLKAV